jgi:hypothetical protein
MLADDPPVLTQDYAVGIDVDVPPACQLQPLRA